MNKKDEQLYRKWRTWIDVLSKEIVDLHIQRHVYNEVRTIVRKNPSLHVGNDFFDWTSVWYASSMMVAIRRQSDRDRDSISYRQLLDGIIKNPEVISRQRFKESFVDGNYKDFLADADCDRYLGVGREYVDLSVAQQEITQLEAKTASLTNYVNKRVAHRDKNQFNATPSHGELDEAIEFLSTLHWKYSGLLTSFPQNDFLPPWGYDWKRVFQYPWHDDGQLEMAKREFV